MWQGLTHEITLFSARTMTVHEIPSVSTRGFCIILCLYIFISLKGAGWITDLKKFIIIRVKRYSYTHVCRIRRAFLFFNETTVFPRDTHIIRSSDVHNIHLRMLRFIMNFTHFIWKSISIYIYIMRIKCLHVRSWMESPNNGCCTRSESWGVDLNAKWKTIDQRVCTLQYICIYMCLLVYTGCRERTERMESPAVYPTAAAGSV